jgi:hypothetical protein
MRKRGGKVSGEAEQLPKEQTMPPHIKSWHPSRMKTIDECGPEWAGRDGNDETTHLDVFAYVMNGFRVLDHRQLVRAHRNQAEQQT